MKTNSLIAWQLPSLAAGVLLSLAPLASAAVDEKADPAADSGAVKEEITATGTVFSVEPELLSVVMKDNPTPVRFAYDKDTPFVDEKGEAVPVDLIRAELPLTVHYGMEGEKMVARRVVVSRSMVAGDTSEKPDQKRKELAGKKAEETSRAAEAEPYLPKEIMGSVATIEQTISIVARGETIPTTCIINNSTRYVNASGQPVSTQLVMPGMPITVKTVRDGKRVIAQEIIIRGNPATLQGSRNTQQDSSNPARNRQGTTDPSGTGVGTEYVIPNQIIPSLAVPTVPTTPTTPNSPATPGTPNSPGQPGTPNSPGQPGTPNSPGQPGAPNSPGQPGTPNSPGQPGAPAQPDVKQPNVPPAGGTTPPAGGTPPPGRNGTTGPATSVPGNR
ncbi:MAG: collagen-like protein [Verrucomicrobiota bacterium]